MVSGITTPVSGQKVSATYWNQLANFVTNLTHGEWTYAVSVGNNAGSTTQLSAGSTPVTLMSSPNITNFVGTSASGFVAGTSGVYTVTLDAQLPVVATGRSFISILSGNNSTEYRAGTTADDVMTVTADFYMTAGDSVSFLFYQTTGATRTITGRFIVHYKGTL